MYWGALVIAGVLEVAWAAGLKASEGFTRPIPAVFTLVTMVASFGLLSLALRGLPLGTAYAVWVGIGAVGTVLFGIAYYGEPATLARLGCIALLVAGIVGLNLTSQS